MHFLRAVLLLFTGTLPNTRWASEAVALHLRHRATSLAATSSAGSGRRGRCRDPKLQLLAVANNSGGEVFADGYSEVTCTVDTAPKGQRTYFSENACGEVSSCRLLELPMEPRLCFDFCRQQETAKFFGLKGHDCYCASYFRTGATGGEGECSFKCEGDTKESCGGPDKTTMFEMHMCADSADEASLAMEAATKMGTEASTMMQTANTTIASLRRLGKSWSFGVCSMAPEGKRVCDLVPGWLSLAEKLQDSSTNVQKVDDVLAEKTAALKVFQSEFTTADATTASNLELTTAAVSGAAVEVRGAAVALNLTIGGVAGPIGRKEFASFNATFQALGDVDKGWSAICGLVPIRTESYAALAPDDPAPCASRCLTLGVKSCAAFNYQYADGLASCQLLSSDGLVETETAISHSVPIFEVSNTKRDSLGITSVDCYAHGAFIAGHPRGPLGTHVIKEVSAL